MSESWLILAVTPVLQTALSTNLPGPWFRLGEIRYDALDDNHASYFVDRILDAEGRLVGMSIQELTGPLPEARIGLTASSLSARGDEEEVLDVFFADQADPKAQRDGSQALADRSSAQLTVPSRSQFSWSLQEVQLRRTAALSKAAVVLYDRDFSFHLRPLDICRKFAEGVFRSATFPGSLE